MKEGVGERGKKKRRRRKERKSVNNVKVTVFHI